MRRLLSGPAPRAVELFRILFGAWALADLLALLLSGRFSYLYLKPMFWFSYPYLEVHPFKAPLMWGIAVTGCVAATALATGVFARVAAAILAWISAYLLLIDQAAYTDPRYLEVLVALLLALVPCEGEWALGSYLFPKRFKKLRRLSVPALPPALLRFQYVAAGFYSGLWKMHGPWLDGSVPGRLMAGGPFGDFGGAAAVGVLSLVLDLFAFPVACFLRPRWGIVLAALSILVRIVLGDPVSDWPLLVLGFVVCSRAFEKGGSPKRERLPAWKKASIGAHVAVQLLVPLRHLTVPGDFRWHEEGSFFSWSLGSRDKRGLFFFTVEAKNVEGAEGKVGVWSVMPGEYLTPLQNARAAGDPRLILALARFAAEAAHARGARDVRVKARAMATISADDPVFLIRPDVDLLAVKDSDPIGTWVTRKK